MAELGTAASATVLFVDPAGADWERTDLWEMAASIPSVRALSDEGGELAHTFGAYTSGQVLLYGPDGQLAFSGGLTPARGHEGDSAGRSAIREIVRDRRTSAITSQVFGCELGPTGSVR